MYLAVWGDGWNVCTEFAPTGHAFKTLTEVEDAIIQCEQLNPTIVHRIYFVQQVIRGIAINLPPELRRHEREKPCADDRDYPELPATQTR